jgi:chromosome segregation protein
LLTDTGRAALYEDALQRLTTLRATRERDAAKLQAMQAGHSEIVAAWRDSWAAAGITPRSAGEMQLWRSKVEAVLNRLGKLDACKVDLEALAASIDAAKAGLIAFLGSMGLVPDASLPPEILFREGKGRVDALQAAWADAKAREVTRLRIKRDLSEAAAAVAAAQAALAAQREAWPAAMEGIGLTATAIPPEAEAALAVWHAVAVPNAARESESQRVEAMESSVRAFVADVFELIDRVAPQLRSESEQEALARLSAALAEARRADETCRRLRQQATQHAAQRQTLTAQRQDVSAVLDEASQAFGVDRDALPGAMQRLAGRHALESEGQTLRRDLSEIADGRDEDALRRERAGLDLDLLPGDIEREELRQAQLLKEIAEASALHHDRKTQLDALLQGRNAAAHAAERAEAGAELVAIAGRWLVRAAAAKLATRAIERHRAMVQDPLIARASILFAMATNGAFDGLVIAYGDDDQPELKAKRRGGDPVPVGGLSEGTCDQLFLALRLALLERHGAGAPPFIGDDLLASFDDARALATLRLLATAGQQRQIILFTHHQHIAELARSLTDQEIDLIDL